MKEIRPGELRNILLEVAFKGRLPVMIWGAPGIGKSQIVRETAAEYGLSMLDLRLNYYEESDLLGIPVKTELGMEFIKYSQLPSSGKGVWFLDELTHARTSLQGLVFQLIQDNAIESYSVPEGWRHFVAASNLASHRSISNPMPSGLRSRFTGGHYILVPDLGDWTAWATSHGVDSRIISFVTYMEKMDRKPWLFRLDGSEPMLTPRNWAIGINYAVSNFKGDLLENTIMGMIGEENGIELLQYLKASSDMPDLNRILEGDLSWFKAEHDPSRYYLLISSLGKEAARNHPNLDRILGIVLSLKDEYAAQAFSLITRTVPRDWLLESKFLSDNLGKFKEILGGIDVKF